MNVKENVVKAMNVIIEWCESRDALEYPCTGCPMERNCKYGEKPDTWTVTE